MHKDRILILGANGQLGSVLVDKLRERYGVDHVLATDITKPKIETGPFKMLDILNVDRLHETIADYKITEIYHLAAILSANGEWNPSKTWNVNLNGLLSVLEVAREDHIKKVFFPSTIAVFGNTTPRENTPQDCPLLPETVYGMSKTAGELWCNYYHKKYGVDVRSLRYPGVIGHQSMPGGGTTDYAVEIYHEALKKGKYTSFLKKDTRLPMIYMEDVIRATFGIMDAEASKIKIRNSYNLTSMSFTPEELAAEIKKHIPNFEIDYQPDFRQAIADSWTNSIDDSAAREDWGWKPTFDLASMTKDMIHHLKPKYQHV